LDRREAASARRKVFVNRRKVSELETPALLVDLDGMEKNLLRMSAALRDKPVKLRPHFKAHQVAAFSTKQMQAGAVGITCARVNHAEALIEHGIKNILIANELVGDRDLHHLLDLSSRAEVIVAVDDTRVISKMAKIGANRRNQIHVVVDLDIGLGRCGVPPGDEAVALAKHVVSEGLTFRGLMAHRGSVRVADLQEKEKIVRAGLQKVVDCKRLIESAGISVEIVSAGATSDYWIAADFPGISEIQPGSYLLMDSWYVPHAADFYPCLSVLATVISCQRGRVVLNAGAKALSGQRGLPVVKGRSGFDVTALHAEHTLVEVQDPSTPVSVGDTMEIWVHYLDGTVSLHDRMFGIRNGVVDDVFPIIH
jgi:D-serine deaminase-like pyridoxal phosphate-dependent protein